MAVINDNGNIRVLFDDGEGVEPVDFNDMQVLAWSRFADHMLINAVPDAIDDPTAPGSVLDMESGDAWTQLGLAYGDFAHAPFPNCGYVRPNGVANQLVTIAGPVMQVIDEPFGSLASTFGEAIAMFRLPANQVITTAVGDAGQPRIDLVEIKLEHVDSDAEVRDFEDAVSRAKTTTNPIKRRRVQCTIQVKQGTPGGTPAYPAPTAGFVPLAAIRVPATHNAVHSADNLRDLRLPLGGVDVYDVNANQMWVPGANPWVLTPGNPNPQLSLVGPAASAGNAIAICPVHGKGARLLALGVYSRNAEDCDLVAIDHNSPGVPTITSLADLGGGAGFQIVGGTGYLACTMVQLMDAMASVGAYPGTRAPNTRIGTPMWCSGDPAGSGKRIAAFPETPSRQLGVRVNGNSTDQLAFVRFFVARGM